MNDMLGLTSAQREGGSVVADIDLITLRDDSIEVVVDVGRGADILTLRHLRTGVDVLFSTPWREHADAIRAGDAGPTAHDPVGGFLEPYRGGWNTLCPNAGPPREVHGAMVGFHGEAAIARWDLVEQAADRVRLRCALHSVPVVIERALVLDAGVIRIDDELVNTSDVDLEIDYVSHPALGGPFIEGCTIETNARGYTSDPGTADGVDGGLRQVPAGATGMAFGWLAEFDGDPWATITNDDLGLAVRLAWDPTHLPYAWFWQELSWTAGYPWYRRARAVAIEPSSTPTSGPDRRSVLALGPRQSAHLSLSLRLNDTKDDA